MLARIRRRVHRRKVQKKLKRFFQTFFSLSQDRAHSRFVVNPRHEFLRLKAVIFSMKDLIHGQEAQRTHPSSDALLFSYVSKALEPNFQSNRRVALSCKMEIILASFTNVTFKFPSPVDTLNARKKILIKISPAKGHGH